MPTYIYGCAEASHDRIEITHGIDEAVDIYCPDCGQEMHRVPQAFRFYRNPADVLYDKLAKRREEKHKERKHGYHR